MAKVSIRDGFSDRNGIKPINTEMQLCNFDERTRNKLQNLITNCFDAAYKGKNWFDDDVQGFLKFVIGDVYSEIVERRDYYISEVFDQVNETIQKSDYDEVLTLIEAVAQYIESYYLKTSFSHYTRDESIYELFNDCFQEEYVGYRFIGTRISPISNDIEASEVREALHGPYSEVNEHISKANAFIANFEKPDYENSIKESILAVETMCKEITGVTGSESSLGRALDKLEEKGVYIQPALKSAFQKIYGYSCEAKGVRHAGNIGGPNSTFEEARYMLVSCSAFVNYLITMSTKTKV